YGYNRCMGNFVKGDQISLRYYAKENKSGTVTLGAALFQTEVFDAAYAKLAESSMIPTLVSDTSVEGAIRVREPGLLYLSIPNDNGWSLYIDGATEPTRITPVGNAMIAVHLEPGTHTVNLQYEAPGFALGFRISMICLLIFWAMVITSLALRFGHPPIVKLPVTLADPRVDSEQPAPDTAPAAEPVPVRNSPVSDAKRNLLRTPQDDALLMDSDADCDLDALFSVDSDPECADFDATERNPGSIGFE
ncbi:MAG: YfhO family protein, partial [Oscillospiraceae bacterium]|nr:YfhO family protein [Oscillospiraceae bacterium]